MKLIAPFEAALRNGVTLVFKVAAAGGQIQLDILPSGKDNQAGIALPPKALVGSAQELDEHLEAFVARYAVAVSRIAQVIASAEGDLQKLEADSTEQARLALEDKRSKNAGRGTKSVAGTKPDRSAELLSPDNEDDDGQDGLPAPGATESAGADPLSANLF